MTEAPVPDGEEVASRESVGPPRPEEMLDLYRLAVEMADRLSVRRGVANSFFLTLNTAVVGVLGTREVRWYLAVAGIMLSAAWWMLLRNYRDLNRAKFGVILAVEEGLPIRIYRDEWSMLQRNATRPAQDTTAARTRLARFRELGAVERLVPVVFGLIYATEIIRQVSR